MSCIFPFDSDSFLFMQEVVGSSQDYAPIKRLLDTLTFITPLDPSLEDQLGLGTSMDLGTVGTHPKRVSFCMRNHCL
jgi:hypothetical protein